MAVQAIEKGSIAITLSSKNSIAAALSLAVDSFAPQTLTFDPLSITIVTIPDDTNAETRMLECTPDLANADIRPKTIRSLRSAEVVDRYAACKAVH